jgi:cell division protease FtsH
MSSTVETGVPTGPNGRPGFQSRPRDDERPTRKPLEFWDRIKLILLFVGAWLVMLWAAFAQFDPEISATQAINQTLLSYWWLLALAGIEALRQLHYLVSEVSPRYHGFWSKRLFGAANRRVGRMNDWTRFRLSRVLKVLFILLILDLALAKIYHLPPATALFQLPVALVQALPFVFQLAFGFFFVILQFVGLFWFLSRGGVDVYFPDDIKTRFTDVKGQDPVLNKVMENMVFIEDPQSIEQRGGYVPGGILLWGPPGTGKTLMAQAVAGETAKPFVFVDPGAFIQMFMGVGILKVKSLYRKLRKLALRYGGVIVFFDEADSLGNRGAASGMPFNASPSPWSAELLCNGMAYLSRANVAYLFQSSLPSTVQAATGHGIIAGLGGMGGGMGTLQSLLSEMDGLKKPRGFFNRVLRKTLGMRPKPPPKYRILHIFATNRPDVLDQAMLRPGRIDRIYKVGFPAKEGRKATYEYYLAKVKHELTDEDVDKLATITPYATGASIKDTVNEALVIAIRDGREAVTWVDVMRAKHLKQLGLPDDFKYVDRERHQTAIHEAAHAVAAYRIQRHLIIDVATIEVRGSVGGLVAPIPLEDIKFEWRSEEDADLIVSLAGLAGERLFFDGDNSNGVASDMRNATALATRMEAYWAMGSTIASHSVTKLSAGGGSGYVMEDGQDRLLAETDLGRAVETRLQRLLVETTSLLEANRQHVLNVAHALEEKKTLSGDDIAAIVEGTTGPTIDGTAYHQPEATELVEAYHTAALKAHHGKGDVSVRLPTLTLPAPVSGNGDGVPPSVATSGNGQPQAGADGEVHVGEAPLPDPPADGDGVKA